MGGGRVPVRVHKAFTVGGHRKIFPREGEWGAGTRLAPGAAGRTWAQAAYGCPPARILYGIEAHCWDRAVRRGGDF